jgi:hypothetical protein
MAQITGLDHIPLNQPIPYEPRIKRGEHALLVSPEEKEAARKEKPKVSDPLQMVFKSFQEALLKQQEASGDQADKPKIKVIMLDEQVEMNGNSKKDQAYEKLLEAVSEMFPAVDEPQQPQEGEEEEKADENEAIDTNSDMFITIDDLVGL